MLINKRDTSVIAGRRNQREAIRRLLSHSQSDLECCRNLIKKGLQSTLLYSDLIVTWGIELLAIEFNPICHPLTAIPRPFFICSVVSVLSILGLPIRKWTNF